MAAYTLPDLSHDYGALAPHISAEIMELHHSKHHQTYVTALNATVEKLAAARESNDSAGGDKPDGDLAAAIDDAFGSYEAFQAHFTAAATTIQGSGWAVLGHDPLGGTLLIHQLYDQQANLPAGQLPIVMLDMWEHAFYLQYRNVKPDYVKAWWNVVNWGDAHQRFTAAAHS